jgi:hypothetical protein
LGTAQFGENEWNQPTGQASYEYAGSQVTMRVQAMRRLLFRFGRHSIPRISCFSLPQTISNHVNGVPFPTGVMGTVVQNKPNTQPEETE